MSYTHASKHEFVAELCRTEVELQLISTVYQLVKVLVMSFDGGVCICMI